MLALALMAALGLMAITAAAAQAEGKLRIEGKVLEEGKTVEGEGEGAAGKLLVPGLGITFECKRLLIHFNGGNLPHWHFLILHLYHECLVVGNKFCTIYPTAADRTAKTNAGLWFWHFLWLYRRFNSADYFVATQEGAEPLSTVYLGGAGCTLPAETAITGSFAVKLPNSKTEAVNHEDVDITEAEEKELKVAIKYGAESASLDEGNSTNLHLIGAELGKKFSLD